MKNYRAIISYDGTHYLGWQNNKNGPSIEATIQSALEQILQHPIKLQAASRTDAGVHAHAQVINFFSPKKIQLISINSLLPTDIAVLSIEETEASFHPTLDAKEKEYRYNLCTTPWQYPIKRFTSWHYPKKLDLSLMHKAAKQLTGTHDFLAFTNKKQNETYDCTTRTLSSIAIHSPQEGCLEFTLKGKNFLYKMVRNLVGTLVYVGEGKITTEEIDSILLSKKRIKAGVTAPAHGLTLYKISYY